jgi:hypothetical protein
MGGQMSRRNHPRGNVRTGPGNIGRGGGGGSYVSGPQTGGLPAAGTPGYSTPTPAPPPVGAPPPDWQQIAAESAATRGVQYADAQATYDRGRISRDFGYGANGQIDPSNPYSKAALLQKNFQEHTLGNTTSYAGQGQLYSGALQNAQNATTSGYLADSNSLHNQYSDALNQTSLNQLGAYSNAGSAVSQDKITAILRALRQG